jgi:putative FmdB family regulatory protein
MPTYDYKCDACGAAFEKFQAISAAPLRKCPHCGAGGLKRLIGTGSGVIFKGGGFYQTDYRSDSYKAAARAEGGGAKADEKPAAKAGAEGGSEAATTAPAKTEPPAPKPPKKKSA